MEDFLRGNSKGKFKGQQYDSQYPDEQSFENLVEYKHVSDVGRQGDKETCDIWGSKDMRIVWDSGIPKF